MHFLFYSIVRHLKDKAYFVKSLQVCHMNKEKVEIGFEKYTGGQKQHTGYWILDQGKLIHLNTIIDRKRLLLSIFFKTEVQIIFYLLVKFYLKKTNETKTKQKPKDVTTTIPALII